MVFFVIVTSITLGTSVFFVRRYFFECEDGDKVLRQKYIRYQEQMGLGDKTTSGTQSSADYYKLHRN